MKKLWFPKQTNSQIGQWIIFLTKKTGEFLVWGCLLLIHYQIMTIICTKLGIYPRSFPDTMENRLLLSYLILMQCGFILWIYSGLDKVLKYVASHIRRFIAALEEKLGCCSERGE